MGSAQIDLADYLPHTYAVVSCRDFFSEVVTLPMDRSKLSALSSKLQGHPLISNQT